MDAFAVSVCKGLSVRTLKAKHAVICGLYFGGFQLLMPLIGFALGVRFQSLITSIDHWIAFVLLGLIGANMVRESREHDDESVSDSFRFMTMLPLAVATSIDALAVGVTFAFLQVDIVPAVSFIGATTFVLSCIGAYAISNSIVDIWAVLVFGFVGFFGGKLGMDTGAMALGVILGPMIEENLGKCLDLAHSVEGGLPAIMFGSNISKVLIFALALSLATPYLLHLKKLRDQQRQAKCLCASDRKTTEDEEHA